MHFLNPWVLWLLTVVPLLGALCVYAAWRRREQFLKDFAEPKLMARFSHPLEKGRYWLKAGCIALGLAALIIAIARPSFENSTTEYPVGKVDVIAVVDVSRSMAVQDYQGKLSGDDFQGGTRLDMARYLILNDIVSALGYNRLGVVSFSGEAFPQAFLTGDMPSLKWVLRRALTISSAPGEGSELAKALNLAVAYFDIDSDRDHRKVIVLLSDGGNDSDPAQLAQVVNEMKKRNIELIVAGLGSKTPHAIPVSQLSRTDQYRFSGQKWYALDGQVVTSGLDENALLYLKNAVGGRYVHVNSASDFHIGSLVSQVELKRIKGEHEVFFYPLMAAVLLFGLAIVAARETQPQKTKGDVQSTLNTLRKVFKRRR